MLKLIDFYNKEIRNLLYKHSDLPKIFVSFEDLVKNPTREAQRLTIFLDLELTEKKVKKIKNSLFQENV